MKKQTLEIDFLNTTFTNPLIIPSGIIPEISQTLKAQTVGAGGVVAKSLTLLQREGNPMPRVIKYKFGLLNSVGLKNPGIKEGKILLKKVLQTSKIPVIVSIFAATASDFKKLAQELLELEIRYLELNLSCPNTVNELGESMGMGVESTQVAISAVRNIVGKKIKLIAKLSPNVQKIGEVAKAAESSGADAISAINAVGPGMVIDINTRKPQLGSKEGGVSGPGIRPIAVRCVYDIYKSVKIPIIGMGGVETSKDVVEMLLAGATLVGIGSAIYQHGYVVIETIKKELQKYIRANRIKKLDQLVGVAHL